MLRFARAMPSLARLRPLLQPAQRPAMAVAAGVAVNLFVRKPVLLMEAPPLDNAPPGSPKNFFLSRNFCEICGDGREIRNKKSH